MGILNNHVKKDTRFVKGDLKIFEPNEFQYNEIVAILENNIVIDENLNAKGELELKVVRYLIREITSVGAEIDEMTDAELSLAFEKGDRDLQLFLREIKTLIEEIIEDIQYKQYHMIDTTIKIFDILNAKDNEEVIKNKFNRLCKRKGIDINFDEFMSLQGNPKELEKRMIPNKIKKKKK